jgi:hypothetical protein
LYHHTIEASKYKFHGCCKVKSGNEWERERRILFQDAVGKNIKSLGGISKPLTCPKTIHRELGGV